jgi:hypothetical protein
MINKKIKLAVFLSILLCWVTLAYAFSSGPPSSNTGAPGEGKCSDCHNRGSNPTGSVKIGGLPQSYTPGTKYNLTVTVAESGKTRWGFQITAIRDDGSAAGTFTLSDTTNTQMASGTVSGRTRMYVQHSFTGTQRGTRDTVTYKVDWTAPSSDVGRVTFYAAGNAANGDGTSSGDNVYFTSNAIMSGGGTTTPAPTLSSINPSSGPSDGGTTITLSGSNFVSGASVTVDTTKVNPNFVDAKTLRIVTPAHAAGVVDLVVTNPDGQAARLRSAFTYTNSQSPAPTVNSINPNSGPTSGGTMVTLTGNNFVSGATVTIGQRQATMVSVTGTQITAITQPGDPGTVNVIVTNPDGQASTLSGGFTYLGGSTSAMVQLLSPNGSEILSSGGLPFMVNWMVMSSSSAKQRLELSTDSGQTFNTVITDNLSADKTSFVYAIPSGINTTKARIRISVIDNGAIISDMSDADFTILPAPTITNLTATVAATIKLKISGTNFKTGAIVEVNGQSAPSTVVKSATSVIAKKIDKTLAGKQVSVRVKNPDGTVSMEMIVTP